MPTMAIGSDLGGSSSPTQAAIAWVSERAAKGWCYKDFKLYQCEQPNSSNEEHRCICTVTCCRKVLEIANVRKCEKL